MGKYMEWASMLFAAVSALLWLRASLVEIKVPKVSLPFQNPPLVMVKPNGTAVDILATAHRQTRLNAYAAGCASVAAACIALKGLF